MKKLTLLVLLLTTFHFSKADNLVLIQLKCISEKNYYFDNPAFKVHFQNSKFLIASTAATIKSNMVLLDKGAWEKNENYSIVYIDNQQKSNYLRSVNNYATNCYENKDMVILKHEEQILPAKNDGMIRIMPHEIRMQKSPLGKLSKTKIADSDPFVESLINEISKTNLENTIQHLQDYGTRIYDSPEAEEAEQWIKEQFELLGLNVVMQDINYDESSKNVLAIQEGTLLPDEYILCGAHYDSFSVGDSAPGADDNASGTAGVLEIARILSQYSFDRTIIYCTWAAEEIGLIGSQYYANKAAQEDMNILGYFNLDMIGYLAPGADFHIDLIYPDESEFLGDFYKSICETYLPEVTVTKDFLSMGSSDHASFNNYGYMGIFPFENIPNYSPHIHTDEDLIGPSVNNFDMAEKFVAASLASIAEFTNIVMPPQDFVAIPDNERVSLSWKTTAGISKFNLYRNNAFLTELDGNSASYIDNDVENENSYIYKISCISSNTGKESSFASSSTVVPMPELTLPYTNNFDDNINYWFAEGDWSITVDEGASNSTSLTDSPHGIYKSNTNANVTLRSFNIPSTIHSLSVNFKVKYELEADFDYVFFEINSNGSWNTLETFNGMQNSWQDISHSLDNYIGKDNIQLRFRMYSDGMIEMDGIYIDDFTIEETVAIQQNFYNSSVHLFPNPAHESIFIQGEDIEFIKIYSISGALIEQFSVDSDQLMIDLKGYEKGVYILHTKTPQKNYTERIIVD